MKKINFRKVIMSFMLVFSLYVGFTMQVSAETVESTLHQHGEQTERLFSVQEVEVNDIILLNDIEDINKYNGADGVYEATLDDGSRLRVTIETTDVVNPRRTAYTTEYIQNKIYLVEYMRPFSDQLDWSSEIVGTFHFDNTYVWCTAGIAYHDFGDSDHSSITYSENTYSSAKVTGVSKYKIKAKIVTPTGTYNISQYVGSDPTGEMSYDISF